VSITLTTNTTVRECRPNYRISSDEPLNRLESIFWRESNKIEIIFSKAKCTSSHTFTALTGMAIWLSDYSDLNISKVTLCKDGLVPRWQNYINCNNKDRKMTLYSLGKNTDIDAQVQNKFDSNNTLATFCKQ